MFFSIRIGSTLLCLLLAPVALAGSYPNIRVSQPGTSNPEEVTIAINPVDPSNLIAGSNLSYSYHSTDGGWTWAQRTISSSMGVWGDPCVIFDAAGNGYYGHLSNPASGYWLDRIVVQKTTDGGATWNDGVGIGLNPPAQQDKEWLVADQTDSPWSGNLYMSWTEFDNYGSPSPGDSSRILFSRSTSSGAAWDLPVRVSDVGGNCIDSDLTTEGAVPAVGPGGEIYVSWSRDGAIWFDRSTDGGVTFGEDVFVATQPGGWDFNVPGIYRCNGLPITACDVSNSPYRGTVYVCWGDQRNGTDDTDVFLIRSTDGGATWGSTITVNDDSGANQQFFPWMTVDPATGAVYVVFYDRRNGAGNETEVYVAMSVDGGSSFTNFVVSDTPFTPTASVFFGDYINIAALSGHVYPIWMRLDGQELSVWMAMVDETAGVPAPLPGDSGSAPLLVAANPWRPGAPISFELGHAARVNVSVFNSGGRLVRTLVDAPRGAGRHSLSWDGDGAGAGVYFLSIAADGATNVKKLVVLD
ncbi:MAG: FlgD immunoglobulin-like domain containing protein [Candidatus Eisenbacteria bacterium]